MNILISLVKYIHIMISRPLAPQNDLIAVHGGDQVTSGNLVRV